MGIAHGGAPTLWAPKPYDLVQVPKTDGPNRRSRLALRRLSADTLKLGLGLLGIPSLERM